MKKILLIILFFISVKSFGQTLTPPNTPGFTSRSTLPVEDKIMSARQHLNLPRYTDTTQANSYGLIDSCGAIIYTYTNSALWFRNCNGYSSRVWIQILPAGGGGGSAGWTLGGNILIPRSDSSVLGSIDNTDWYLISNNQKFLKLNRAGIQANSGSVVNLGVNMSTGDLSFGSSGSTPTWQQTLTAGSTLNQDNTASLGSNKFDLSSATEGNGIVIDPDNNITKIGDVNVVGTGGVFTVYNNSPGRAYFDVTAHDGLFGINTNSPDSALKVVGGIYGTRGLRLSSLTNLSTQNRLLGQFETDGNVGYVTMGTGVSLSAGVLSATGTGGTVTSVGFTGGLISVANPTTTPAFTVAGTSGGIPYFSSTSTWASSALLAANSLMIGGGAGTAPRTSTASAEFATLGGGATAAELRFLEPSGSGTNYTGFKAAAMAGNTIYTLPNAFPAGTYLLQSTSAGVMSFLDPATLTGLPYIAVTGTSNLTGATTVEMSGQNFTISDGSTTGNIVLSPNAGQIELTMDAAAKTFTATAASGYFFNTGAVQMNAYGPGAATFDGSGNITSVSDRREKHDITPFRYGLNAILKLNTSSFIYNKDASNTVMSGFIAQDVQKAIPIAVHSKLNPATGKESMLSLETNAILAANVNATKELYSMIVKQQREIDELKKQLKNK